MLESKINDSIMRLQKGDLTAMDIEAIVFYASPNLELGSGFGSAIAARGGMSIQEELKPHGTISTGSAVVTSAGEMKPKPLDSLNHFTVPVVAILITFKNKK